MNELQPPPMRKFKLASEVAVGDIVLFPTGSGDRRFKVTKICNNPHYNWVGFEHDAPAFNFHGWYRPTDEIALPFPVADKTRAEVWFEIADKAALYATAFIKANGEPVKLLGLRAVGVFVTEAIDGAEKDFGCEELDRYCL